MRKYFIYFFAAVALMSACTETGPMEKPANRKDSGKSLFIGTIEQPGSPLTKTTVTEDSDAERASITWEAGDEILVYGNATGTSFSFYADQSGDEANFWNADASVPAWLTANDEAGYVAYYPAYANGFYDDETMPKMPIKLSCDNDGINQVALENMPLVAELMNAGPGYKQRPLRFECKYAILKVTMPESFECDKMTITCGEEEMLAAVSDLADGPKVVYVPIYKCGNDFSGLKIKVDCEPEAVMQIYGGEELGATTVPEPIYDPNTIYAFDLCNTLTIAEKGEYTLAANTLDYKVNISAGITDPVIINATGDNAPKNITINARGHMVSDLTINAPNSHVEILNGEATNVTAKTSLNSFVVKETFTIKTATVEGGSIVVEGDADKNANVSEIVVPQDAKNVRVYVGDIKDDSDKPVQITNYADKDDVVVVGIKAGDDGKGEYTVKQEGTGEVTEVSSAVAKIGDAQYATLADAFASAKDGETVTLVSSTVLSAQVELAGKAITLDLNGQTISWNGGFKASGIILVHNGADLTINDTVGTGKIYSGGENQAYAAVALTKKYDSAASPAVLTVKGGELEGWYYAVVGNGERHNTVININGGTLKTAVGSAIYNPQNGQINIAGGVVEGYETGIYMKAGTAAVATGGTIRATGPKNPYKYDGNGANGTGDAIVVDNCGYPGGAPSLTINGAELVSANAYQVGAYYDGKNATEISDILSSDNTLTVPAGYEWQEDATSGMYKLVKAAAKTAKIGDVEYGTLEEAFAAVPVDGTATTVTLLQNIGNKANDVITWTEYDREFAYTVSDKQNITFDLNGKKIYAKTTVNGYTGFLLVKNGGSLTIKDSAEGGEINYLDGKDNTGGLAISSEGNLVIESGTIENHTVCVNSSIQGAIDVHANEWGNHYAYHVTFTMNGGVLKSQTDNTLRIYDSSQTGTGSVVIDSEINGGEVYGADAVFIMTQWTKTYCSNETYMNNINVSVKGGKFITNNGIRVVGNVGETNNKDYTAIKINVSGGDFTILSNAKYREKNVAFQNSANWLSSEETTINLRSYTTVSWTASDPTYPESK